MRGTGSTSGLDPDLATQFYETITSSSPMAVAPTDPLSISGSFNPTRGLNVTGTAALSGNVASEVSAIAGSGSNGDISGATSVVDSVTNNTAIQITPKNLPSGAYQVYVVMSDTTEWHSVGSFVMPATITAASDGPNNTVIINNQLILQPVPVAPLPDNDFSKSSNSLGITWMESGIVRFATTNMPTLTFKAPKSGKIPASIKDVPTGDFDDGINPFDIYAIVVRNAYTGKVILSSPLKGNSSYDTTNTNLLSLVMPTSNFDESLAGGIANLKTAFSHAKNKLIPTKTASLNFSVTGLPANKKYAIQKDGKDLESQLDGTLYTVTTNSKGSLVITSSSLAKKKTTAGLTTVAGTDIDLASVSSITLNEAFTDSGTGVTTSGDPLMWVAF